MKRILLLIYVTILFGCSDLPNDSVKLGDIQLAKMIEGSWVCDSRDKNCDPSRSTYNEDGTLFVVLFNSESCTQVISELSGTWEIKDGKLRLIVNKSSGEFRFPIGYEIVDNILEISDSHMVLRGKSNRNQLRVHSAKCQYGT